MELCFLLWQVCETFWSHRWPHMHYFCFFPGMYFKLTWWSLTANSMIIVRKLPFQYRCSTLSLEYWEDQHYGNMYSEQHIMQATYGVRPWWQLKYFHRQKNRIESMTVANQFQIGQICRKHQVLSVIWLNAGATQRKAVMDDVNVLMPCYLILNCVCAKGKGECERDDWSQWAQTVIELTLFLEKQVLV